MRNLAFAVALIGLAAGCASTPRIVTDFDPAADFSGFRTYSWVTTTPPAGADPLLHARIRASIDRALSARSFREAPPGDFAVTFTTQARDRIQVSDLGPYAPFYRHPWGWRRSHQVQVWQNREGTLAIDIFDTQTRRPVWRGTATQDITRQRVDQAQIDAAVDEMLARFPPSAER